MFRIFLLAAMLYFMFATRAFAEIISVPEHYQVIQDAVNFASDGDTILLSLGDYFQTIRIYEKSLTLASNYIISRDSLVIGETVLNDIFEEEFPHLIEISGDTTDSVSIVGLSFIGAGIERDPIHGVAIINDTTVLSLTRCHFSGWDASHTNLIKINSANSYLNECVFDSNIVFSGLVNIYDRYVSHKYHEFISCRFSNTSGIYPRLTPDFCVKRHFVLCDRRAMTIPF